MGLFLFIESTSTIYTKFSINLDHHKYEVNVNKKKPDSLYMTTLALTVPCLSAQKIYGATSGRSFSMMDLIKSVYGERGADDVVCCKYT